MKQVITDNGNFTRSLELLKCASPNNYYQLKFTSKWRDAKNPDDEQVNFTAMLTKEEIESLGDFLKNTDN